MASTSEDDTLDIPNNDAPLVSSMYTKILMRPHPTTVPLPSGVGYDADWNGLFRLLSYALISSGGAMGSIFIVSALTVVSTLMNRGNSFLASLCIGHLVVTVFVIPATCVIIMSSGSTNHPTLCHYQWLGTMITLFVHVLSFLFISIDAWKGLGRNPNIYFNCCTKFRIITSILFIWFISIGLVFSLHINDWGPEICRKAVNVTTVNPISSTQSPTILSSTTPSVSISPTSTSSSTITHYIKINRRPWLQGHSFVGGGLIIFPTLLTILFLIRSMVRVKWYRERLAENPLSPIYFLTDESLLKSHVVVYTISAFMWAPLVVVTVVDQHQDVDSSIIDTVWWLAMANSCSFSFIYAFTNRDLGESFLQLFYYCCCKSHVNWVRKTTVGGILSGGGIGSLSQRGSLAMAPSMGTSQGAVHHGYHHPLMAASTLSGVGSGGGLGSGSGGSGHPTITARPVGPGFGMVALGGGVSGGGICGGGPFRAFRGVTHL